MLLFRETYCLLLYWCYRHRFIFWDQQARRDNSKAFTFNAVREFQRSLRCMVELLQYHWKIPRTLENSQIHKVSETTSLLSPLPFLPFVEITGASHLHDGELTIIKNSVDLLAAQGRPMDAVNSWAFPIFTSLPQNWSSPVAFSQRTFTTMPVTKSRNSGRATVRWQDGWYTSTVFIFKHWHSQPGHLGNTAQGYSQSPSGPLRPTSTFEVTAAESQIGQSNTSLLLN